MEIKRRRWKMTETKANRNHKDSVFTLLFSEPTATLELYNAVTGQNYPPDTKIEIVTLSNALFKGQLNDVAFVVDDRLVVLIEHQSTVNNNMPLRMLLYMAREYERMTKGKDLYREKMIKIPSPEFIVLYNGREEFPDFKELRLSDAYKSKEGGSNLELVAKVYNISKGRNADIASRSPVLSGYAELIAEVNRNRETMEPAEAIAATIKSCVERNILVYFLEKHGSEVLNMLFTEWNQDDALAVRYEEGLEDGREEGLEKGIGIGREELFALLESGVSLAEAKNILRG
jgi:hypothetical protein